MAGELTRFLKSEYEEAGVSPAYIRLQGKHYLIPYPYVRDFDEFQKAFMNDFFDGMRRDYVQYKKHNEPVRYAQWNDEEERQRLIIPYDLKNKSLSAEDVAQRVFSRADKKYRKAVRLAAQLATAYPERPYQTFISIPQVREMQKALYEYHLKQARNNAVYMTKKVGGFLAKNAVKVTNNLKNLSMDDLKLKARKWAVKLMLTATVAAAVYTAVNYDDIKEQNKAKKEQQAKDPLGNLKMFDECRNDIKATLAFVENFAPNVFKDGEGYPTIGYGCTYYLDENGKGNREISPVKMGESITKKDAMLQKNRYLDFRILPQIERIIQVPMDKPTMIATVNFAYVIGPANFAKSKYLEALNQGKKGAELANYMTGFRKQKGLLLRCYFMAEILKKNLTAAELLPLTAEGCYNLTIKDVCEHKAGKLVIDTEDMARFRDGNLDKNLKKAAKKRRSVVNGGNQCPVVADILPDDVIKAVTKSATFNYKPSKER